MKRKFRLIALTLLISCTALAADPVYNFQGGVSVGPGKGLTVAQLKPTPPPGNFFYTWCYTFILFMEDGSSATIQFTYWELSLVNRYGTVFSFIDQGDRHTIQNQIFEEEQTSWKDKPARLTMGPNFWEQDGKAFRIHVDLPEGEKGPAMKADLTINARVPGWRPGTGPVHYGAPDGPWYDLVVPLPWGDLEGKVVIAGKEKQVKGWGYSDHNTQTVLPTDQLGTILALRSFSPDRSINFLEYIAPADYGATRTTWLIVMKDDQMIFATDQWERELLDYQTEPNTGYRYPTRVKVTVTDPKVTLEGEIKGKKVIEVLEPLDQLPSWVRSVADKFFNAPAFIRQNVDVSWHLQVPAEGVDENFTCQGVFENTIVK